MRRIKAVVNIPIRDTFRLRMGNERHVRDAYLKNIGNLGDGLKGRDKGMGDIDYWTARLSVVADLTPDLENYTIASYTKSESNGVIPSCGCANPA
jgi:iron complex outermembrane receptor protein